MTTNPWDNKVLTFDALNAALPDQIYVTCDGEARHALRGDTVGSRVPLAPLVAFDPPRADGTDYALTEDRFTPGFVVLPGDAALFTAAIEAAKTRSYVTAPARGVEALIIHELAPDPAPAPAAPAPAETPETPAEPEAVETVALPRAHHNRLVEFLQHVPSYLKVGYHEVLAEIEKL